MRVLLVHPSPLLFSEIYLRLEPLGLECVAAAVDAAGHEARLLDLQVFAPRRYQEMLDAWRPAVVGFYFVRMLFKFGRVYNAERLHADHEREVRYALRIPEAPAAGRPARGELYVHHPTAVAAPG